MTGVLAIVGAGGHARVVADCAALSGWTDIRLFDDASQASSGPWSVAGSTDDLMRGLSALDGVALGVGDNAARLDWHRRLAAAGGRMISLVHPAASVSPHARIAPGAVVLAGGRVCIGADLGEAVIVNTNAVVDHDGAVEEGAHISPGAALAGGVRVGRRGWIGLGAVVRQGLTIGRDAVVGAGAVVVRDVADGITVVGNPARPLERRPC